MYVRTQLNGTHDIKLIIFLLVIMIGCHVDVGMVTQEASCTRQLHEGRGMCKLVSRQGNRGAFSPKSS